MDNSEFERIVAARLESAQIRFERQALINGFVADFVAYAPDERVAVIESKSWPWYTGNVARAGDLANSIQERTGASAVFIVLEKLDRNWPSRNVYTPDGIAEGVKGWIRKKAEDIVKHIPTGRLEILGKTPTTRKTLFAAMPFDRKYDDTFVIAMTQAAEAIDGKAVRVDEEQFTEAIVDRIKDDIANCSVLVADVSKSNPNVLYELGYGRGVKIPCVQICSTSLKKLPFDIRHYPTLEYTVGAVNKLVPNLVKRVKAVVP